MHAGIDHQRQHFPLFDDGVGVGHFVDLFAHGQGFTGKRCLVDKQIVAMQQLHISRHNISDLELDDVAGHKFARQYYFESAVTPGQYLIGQPLLQRLQCV
ncbi:hypothetical protein BMS3Abin10_00015 [bacterium BMS3Abin10]|nr:hypothetical protein BMS3Abin10_00015 [bacterium BMS3Abin10]